jgi:uncharacterized protein YpmB
VKKKNVIAFVVGALLLIALMVAGFAMVHQIMAPPDKENFLE